MCPPETPEGLANAPGRRLAKAILVGGAGLLFEGYPWGPLEKKLRELRINKLQGSKKVNKGRNRERGGVPLRVINRGEHINVQT